MNEELTREAMDEKMDGDKPVEAPKATPGEGEPGGEAEPLVEKPPVEPPVTPPDGEEPKPTDDTGKSGEPEDDSEKGRDAKENTPKGVQKRIDRAVKKQGAAEGRAAFAEGEAKALKEQLAMVTETPLPELVAPNPDDYEDYDKYTHALVKHELALRDRETDEKAKILDDVKPEPIPQLTEEQEAVREVMVDNLEEMREKYEDFDEVAFGVDEQGKHTFPVTQFMKEGMESSESKMEILYYLGQNTAEAEKIAKLPPTKQVMAIGQLDSRLKSPATKKIKTPGAPAPIVPAGGTGNSAPLDMDKLSNDEWMELRNKQTGQGGK